MPDPFDWLVDVGKKLLNVPASGMPADKWQAAWAKVIAGAESDLNALVAEGFRGTTQEMAQRLNAFMDARLQKLPEPPPVPPLSEPTAAPSPVKEALRLYVARHTLGVSQDCTLKEAEAAYRHAVKSIRPDLGGDPEAFEKATAAIKTLREFEKRSQG